jgi:hypothetical protein
MREFDRSVLHRLGLDPAVPVETIRERQGHGVFRLRPAAESLVVKVWSDPAAATEVRAYRILADLGVPTIRVIGTTDRAILLEDLEISARWRPAIDDDLATPQMISALADWYRLLHQAGSPPGPWAAEIPDEYAHLSVDAMRRAGRSLDLDRKARWIKAANAVEPLLITWKTLPRTLIYNDFHVSNLAVARTTAQSVMIDFDRLRIGTAAGDLRNVTGQLNPTARQVFLEEYGPVREPELIIDAPLAVIGALCGLDPTLPRIPRWARVLRDEVVDGTLDRKLDAALELD